MNIGKVLELEAFEITTKSGEKLSLARSLSDFAGIETLLVHHEVLPPGRRASGPHFHSVKEEIFIVLAGTPSVWVDGEVFELKQGNSVGFNNRENRAHMLVNASGEEAVILTIGTNPGDDVTTFVEETSFKTSSTADSTQ